MNANQLTKIPLEKLSDTLQFLIAENEIPLSDALKQVIDDVDAVCKKLLRGEPAPAQPVSEPYKLPDGKDSAISEAVAAIYLNDSTDYLPALFSVVNALSPEIFSLLLSNEKAAFDATRLPAAPAQEQK